MSQLEKAVIPGEPSKPAPAKAGGGAIEGNAADDALMVDQAGQIDI